MQHPLSSLYAIFAKDTDVEGEQQLMDELISDYTAKSKAANTQLQHYNTFQNAKDIGGNLIMSSIMLLMF